MKTINAALIAAFILSACGGGGSDSTPAQTQTTQTSTATTVTLPVFLNPVTVTGSQITLGQLGGTYLVQPSGVGMLTMSGNSQTVKIDAAGAVGVFQISGDMNNVIFSKDATVSSLTITGKMNTIYLPEGSKIVVANAASMATTNVIKYYKL